MGVLHQCLRPGEPLRDRAPLVDFDWDWPKKIDRPLLERALTLDFVQILIIRRLIRLIMSTNSGTGSKM